MVDKKEKIRFFQSEILEWFATNGRMFDWRSPGLSDYEIIISEILLQRTKAETISKFFNIFISQFPGWAALASAQLQDIEECLKPIGLYRQRAARIKALANYIEENGLPLERVELDRVPSMGQYIANAVELLIRRNKKPLLDVNMARVLERFFGPRKLVDIRYDPYLRDISHDVVNHKRSKDINWAILDFATLVCKIRNPLCESCVLANKCLYYQYSKLNN